MNHTSEYAYMHRASPELRAERREDAITARAAEILADNNELTNAAAEDPEVERALCEVSRIAMDRRGWPRVTIATALHDAVVTPPQMFLAATTALRAALYAYAERELDKEDLE